MQDLVAKAGFIVLAGAVVFGAHVSVFGQQTPKNAVSFQGWTVTAEKPVSVGEDLIQGSVTFTRDEEESALTRGGGMCLIADLFGGVPCESKDDCSLLPVPVGGVHYCIGANGSKRKICWTRPTAGGCIRSPSRLPGTYFAPAVPVLVDGQVVNWITLACMADEAVPLGCGLGDPSLFEYATSKIFNPFADEQ